MPSLDRVEPIPVADGTIDDEFWNHWIDLTRADLLEYQYEQLEESGCLENFRRAADGADGGFRGMWFADSDAYKWLEAASYVLATREDAALRRRVDEVIDLVAAAQEDDGYLNTYFALEEPERKWTNLNMMHELYCAGHLIEAAVAHYRATDETALLDVATALADRVDELFGDEIDGVPGHQEIELALVELGRATGDDRYVDLAQYFVELRGRDDCLEREFERLDEIAGYDPEDGGIAAGAREVFYEDGEYDGSYAQAHTPFFEQETVEGHSVRAMYFFAGVADVAAETGDEALLDHLESLWENMTEKRTYVTGGIGSSAHGERFTDDYHLPNETAYAETCAAIGSVFWNQRLFGLTGDARYADLIERTLYNAVLAGISSDGGEFFYDNRLESDGDHHRQGWFDCACCPPNVARLFASLGRYLYATGERRLYVTQYVGSSATATIGGADVEIEQASGLPWDGDATIDVRAATPTEFTLFLRLPEWRDDESVRVNGEEVSTAAVDGYLPLEREWDDDRIEIAFGQSVVPVEAHPAVEADAGRVALTRGPLVYCLEGADNERPLHQYRIDGESNFEASSRDDLLGGVVTVDGDATVPDLEDWDGELYRPASETTRRATSITAVPYYAWDNRDPGEMRVWLRGDT
ncbi:glycoside hydrolase family 127 protein [Halosolutus gelatinilyticus]|uniref:glycoside hydrolase family 127 protein n=1 Tax=Halosolutus gelatinilyticus TaxID=2931975 RepID=UPI001FF14F47|nr:beta-L-arabinofuranosidase domain-containing protein [Halosolutus gelatinilyticus]